jgi:hypothetical protein
MTRAILLFVSCLPLLTAQAPPPAAGLNGEFERARAAPGASRSAVVDDFVARFQAGARARAGTGDAVPYLLWILQHGGLGDAAAGAVETLVEAHAKAPEMAQVAERLGYFALALGRERVRVLLDRIAAANGHPEVQAQALFARVTAELCRPDGPADEDQAALAKDLAAVVKLTKDAGLAARAKATSTGERGRAVGQRAPEIVGVDLDDVPFRLSDYRGKVVVLDFWGDW